jgi:hypothetical protein
LKLDKYVKDLSEKLDDFSNGGIGNEDDNDDSYGLLLYKHDDDYYLDRGEVPLWFTHHPVLALNFFP